MLTSANVSVRVLCFVMKRKSISESAASLMTSLELQR
jgi:hypothetical protein